MSCPNAVALPRRMNPGAVGRAFVPGVTRAAKADHHLERILALITVVVPMIGLTAAIAMLWNTAIGPVELTLMGVMYVLTAMGLSLGFHRHFSHQSFKTVPAVRMLLGALGSMAAEGPSCLGGHAPPTSSIQRPGWRSAFT